MFLNKNFLLKSPLAQKLFAAAENMPIIDYHCHLNPEQIAKNKNFGSITELWLAGDHYKWRLMRACGVDERYITGDACDREKFRAFAKILPLCIGNPIYIWCHLELARYFGITDALNCENADIIFDRCNKMLAQPDFNPQRLIANSRVAALCTTDDPADTLEWHGLIASSDFGVKVYPTFRPDAAVHIERPTFCEYLERLSQVSGIEIDGVDELLKALFARLDAFIAFGCFVSDHALDKFIFEQCNLCEAQKIFAKRLNNERLTQKEVETFQTFVLCELARQYAKKGIAMQLHYNCVRNINTVMWKKLGADTGYDCINGSCESHKLALLLDALNQTGELPKTIVYSLDPNDNALINTVIQAFQSDGCRLQHGSAWWFNDTKSGMRAQITTLAESGVLGNFVGMLTDSRSFISYTRHEYFRRILCDVLADQVLCGEYPNDEKQLLELIERICWKNAAEFFPVPL